MAAMPPRLGARVACWVGVASLLLLLTGAASFSATPGAKDEVAEDIDEVAALQLQVSLQSGRNRPAGASGAGWGPSAGPQEIAPYSERLDVGGSPSREPSDKEAAPGEVASLEKRLLKLESHLQALEEERQHEKPQEAQLFQASHPDQKEPKQSAAGHGPPIWGSREERRRVLLVGHDLPPMDQLTMIASLASMVVFLAYCFIRCRPETEKPHILVGRSSGPPAGCGILERGT
mmetsp:Transcript_9364/g.21290  ORF Transcript_9364/g.21290 Transcript_9364/m.21290 type:complete len:233 (+) Transcript_9364:63-761(+)